MIRRSFSYSANRGVVRETNKMEPITGEPKGHAKNYGTIAKILEICLKQPLDYSHIVARTGLNYAEAMGYSEYLAETGLLQTKELFTGSNALGYSTRIYWTSYRGKIVLAHLEAMRRLVDLKEYSKLD